MIYFNENKHAYMQEIDNPLCVIPEEIWTKITPNDRLGTEWDIIDGSFVLIKESSEYIAARQKEQEKAGLRAEKMLKLTRGDVFRGLLKAKGITKNQIKTVIDNLPEETEEEQLTKQLAIIDFEDALDFYRGNPLIDVIGESLGLTSVQLTEFFRTNDYTKLIGETTDNE